MKRPQKPSRSRHSWLPFVGAGGLLVIGIGLAAVLLGRPSVSVLPTAALIPTATRTAVAAQPPTPAETVLPEAGFALSADQTSIIADGQSLVAVTVTTLDPALAGETIGLALVGEGELETTQVTLPEIGSTATFHYTPGQTNTRIRIEASWRGPDRLQKAELTLTLILESFDLSARMRPPQTTPFMVPIDLELINSSTPIQGQYPIQVSLARGGLLKRTPDDPGSSLLEVIPTSQTDGSARSVIYFVPDDPAVSEEVMLRIQAFTRNDLEALTLPLYWRNLETRVAILETQTVSRSVPEGDQRLLWTLTSSNRLCFMAYDERSVPVTPPLAFVSYEVLLSPAPDAAHLALQEGILPGTRLSTDSNGQGRPVFTPGQPTCLAFSAATDAVPLMGGLLRVEAGAVFADRSDHALIIAHYGQLSPQDEPTTFQLALSDGSQAALTLPPTSHPLFRITPASPSPQSFLIPLWLPAAQLDAVQGTTIPLPELTLYLTPDDYEAGTARLIVAMQGQATDDLWIVSDAQGTPYQERVQQGNRSETLMKIYLLVSSP